MRCIVAISMLYIRSVCIYTVATLQLCIVAMLQIYIVAAEVNAIYADLREGIKGESIGFQYK